jgi:hypothetical protein
MLKRCALMLAFTALVAGSAQADPVVGGGGFRAGFSVDPEQLVLGGQLIIGEIAPDMTFDPNLELGFGDGYTIIAANMDLHYHFTIDGSRWRPYVGGGIGINFIEFDRGPGVGDNSNTEVGGNFIIGAGVPTASNNRFFTELKFGLGDIPALKALAGINFKM